MSETLKTPSPIENINDEMWNQLSEVEKLVAKRLQQGFFDWEITGKDLEYLLDQCPYLQIVNADKSTYGEPGFSVRDSRSGWKVHDYGDAMSSSPGRYIFGRGYVLEDDDDEEGGGAVNPGKGTIVNQAVETAFEMVEMAIQKGWGGIMLVEGHPLMEWAAWSKARDYGFVLQNYQASEQDMLKHERLAMGSDLLNQLRPEP